MSLILASLLYPINDVTTSFEAPPAFVEIAKLEAHQGVDLSYPAKFKDRQIEQHKDIAPLATTRSPDEMFSKVEDAATAESTWTIVSADRANRRLEAIATTPLMKFRDDVVIEVRAAPNGSEVHMRSRSRVGRSDLGANAKRIRSFLAKLN